MLTHSIESADWVVLNRRWDLLNETNRSIQFGPDTPNHFVREKFDLWLESGEYLLFRNRRLRLE